MRSELLLAIIIASTARVSDLLLPIKASWFMAIRPLGLCRLFLRRTLPITASITRTAVILAEAQEFIE